VNNLLRLLALHFVLVKDKNYLKIERDCPINVVQLVAIRNIIGKVDVLIFHFSKVDFFSSFTMSQIHFSNENTLSLC
jgi:hypothetical protein